MGNRRSKRSGQPLLTTDYTVVSKALRLLGQDYISQGKKPFAANRDPVTGKITKAFLGSDFPVPAKMIFNEKQVVKSYSSGIKSKLEASTKSKGGKDAYFKKNGVMQRVVISDIVVKNQSFHSQRMLDRAKKGLEKKQPDSIAKFIKGKDGKYYLVGGHSDAAATAIAKLSGGTRGIIGLVIDE